MKVLAKKIIYGCESRGDGDSPYLMRLTLLETKLGAAYIHVFHRSDADEHHDHPWPFVSLILWRGYLEETPRPCVCGTEPMPDGRRYWCDRCMPHRLRRMWPGMILFRRATHRHRVQLVDRKRAVTFVIRGPYVREWGFFREDGHWQRWKEYFAERGC